MKNSARHESFGYKIPAQLVSVGLWIDSSKNFGKRSQDTASALLSGT
jgi:hypothetical protein